MCYFFFHVGTCLHKRVKEKVEQGYSTQSVIKIACIAVMCRKLSQLEAPVRKNKTELESGLHMSPLLSQNYVCQAADWLPYSCLLLLSHWKPERCAQSFPNAEHCRTGTFSTETLHTVISAHLLQTNPHWWLWGP